MAITFEQAKRAALQYDKNINVCYEYKDGYHFLNKNNDNVGYSGIVILKNTGKRINWIDFIFQYHPEKTPRETNLAELKKSSLPIKLYDTVRIKKTGELAIVVEIIANGASQTFMLEKIDSPHFPDFYEISDFEPIA